MKYHFFAKVTNKSKPLFWSSVSHSTWFIPPISYMMISCHGNPFHITGHLCGESTSDWWIPLTKGQQSRSLIFLLVWTSFWINSRVASNLRCHGTPMTSLSYHSALPWCHSCITPHQPWILGPLCMSVCIGKHTAFKDWSALHWTFNSSPPGQNGHHFTDSVFRCNEKVCIFIKISLNFVPKCPIDNNQALV